MTSVIGTEAKVVINPGQPDKPQPFRNLSGQVQGRLETFDQELVRKIRVRQIYREVLESHLQILDQRRRK